MSAPARGQREAASTRGGGASGAAQRGGGVNRGRTSSPSRATGGRGRGAITTNPRAAGLLQGLRSGTANVRGSGNGGTRATRGSATARRGQTTAPGRGSLSVTFNAPSAPTLQPSSPAPSTLSTFNNTIDNRYQELKKRRDGERARAIRDGFLADPEKKTSLDHAITPVGTCTDMCPEFERVERIVQNMVDRAEKLPDEATGRAMPSQARMIKKFKRSAAGDDEQLPSDIRTLDTLRETLNFLFDNVVGGEERLATIHKFVWDRTRGVRNDFSIQQVSKVEDVKIAVDCFERIARFHILSLHQLSNPDNLEGDNFDAHQDREQLNNTLLSLIYYYDDYRDRMSFPNEGEFRAYCIIFELQSQHPDLEDRMQSWPKSLLNDGRVKSAFKLYSAAGNTVFDQGPLRPMIPFSLAQGNSGTFWTYLRSKAVSYLMACVAEIYFAQVRYTALQGLWKSAKSSPTALQAKNQDWTVHELMSFLGFDTEEQTLEFCGAFNLSFRENIKGEQYLDLTAQISSLDRALIPNKQIFSGLVEEKRCRRTLVAVINGLSAPAAIRQGQVETNIDEQDTAEATGDEEEDSSSLFFPDTRTHPSLAVNDTTKTANTSFNPGASTFTSRAGLFGTSQTSAAGATPTTSIFRSGPVFTEFASDSSEKPPKPPTTSFPTLSTLPPTTNSAVAGQQQKDASFNFTPRQPTNTQPSNDGGTSWSSSSVFNISSAPSFLTSEPTFSWPAATTQTPKIGTAPSQQPLFPQQTSTQPQLPSFAGSHAPNQAGPGLFAPTIFDLNFVAPALAISQTSTQAPAPQGTPKPMFTFPQPPPSASQSGQSTSFGNLSASSLPQPSSNLLQRPSFEFSNQPSNSLTPPKLPLFTFSSSPQPSLSSPAGPLPAGALKSTEVHPVSPRTSSPHLFPPLQASRAASPQSPERAPPSATQPSTQPSAQPVVTAEDRERVVNIIARLGFLQPNGLLQQYLEFCLPDLLKAEMFSWTRDVRDAQRRKVRQMFLAEKYGQRWREHVRKIKMRRKSKIRRQAYAEFFKDAEEKEAAERKRNKELEEILDAQRMKERIQAEQRDAKLEEERRLKEKKLARKEKLNKSQEEANRKRKSTGEQSAGLKETPRKLLRTSLHRRSQSSAAAFADSGKGPIFSGLAGSQQYIRNIFDGKPHNGHYFPINQSSTRDRTQTDYFRLKALGLDPDTPIRPHTAESLIAAQRKEEERKRMAAMPPRVRRGTPSQAWHKLLAEWDAKDKAIAEAEAEAKARKSAAFTEQLRPASSHSASSWLSKDSEGMMQDLSEIDRQIIEATEWMRSERLRMEKEEQDELRRSQSSQGSNHQVDANGLITVNGYKVRPFPTTPGKPLNRMEQRIMRTGARGAATAHIPGTPGYRPIAKSKYSRLRDSLGIGKEGLELVEADGALERGVSNGIFTSYEHSPAEADLKTNGNQESTLVSKLFRRGDIAVHKAHQANTALQPSSKAPSMSAGSLASQQKPFQSVNGSSGNRFAALNDEAEDELLEDDDDELLEDDEDMQEPQQGQYYNDYDDASNEYGDDESEDGEDEDDEEADEYEGEDDLQALSQHAYLNVPKGNTPASIGGTAMSRVTSGTGTGASADDAVLLDSD